MEGEEMIHMAIDEKLTGLKNEIESIRAELGEVLEKGSTDFLDPRTGEVSAKLDELISQYLRIRELLDRKSDDE